MDIKTKLGCISMWLETQRGTENLKTTSSSNKNESKDEMKIVFLQNFLANFT